MSNATNTQYREIKRKAAAGERIRIVDTQDYRYENGEEFVVDEATTFGAALIKHPLGTNDGRAFVDYEEYVVLEPVSATPDLAEAFAATFAQFIRDHADTIRAVLDGGVVAEPGVVEPVKPAPLTRAAVIEQARADVAELIRIGGDIFSDLPKTSPFHSVFYSVEFHVNREKRVVTALVSKTDARGNAMVRNDAIGIAKCAPGDVFNADIGKAIAARKALGLTLPDEYVNAPQPDEPRVGAVVEKTALSYEGERGVVVSFFSSGARFKTESGKSGTGDGRVWADFRFLRILDDTDVDYSGEVTEGAAA